MPRIARIVVTDCPHHVTQRGNYKQEVFSTQEDYIRYLEWLSEYIAKYDLSVLAFCLMPNHVHFLAIPHKKDSFAKTFNTCHMRYSQYHNKKQQVTGHLWQGRFYSCALDDVHLYEAIRYVENNPIKSRLVKEAGQWPWSSARQHLGIEKCRLLLGNIKDYLEISDWDKYLKEKGKEEITTKIKANTLSGRPSGSDIFIAGLEKSFGIRLSPSPEGRPKQIN